MKLKYFLPLMALLVDVHAQDAAQSPDDQAAQSDPPKAQVIEEDEEDVDVAQGVAEPVAPPVKAEPAEEVVDSKAMDAEQDGESNAPSEEAVVSELSDEEDEDVSINQEPANEGIQIQVEKFTAKSGGNRSAGEVKVSSPWPAKPLDTPPLGWKFVPAPEGVSPYRTTVQLGGDRSVNLSITPYVLVPVSDGRNVIRIAEPGYRPENTHLQNDTVGTILQQSTEDIEHSEKKTSEAINRLQQLLSSLPQP